MAEHVFNGITTEEGQQALTNKELADLIVRRYEFDDDSEDTYHRNGKVWASGYDRFGKFICFDITHAGYACISPDLSLHLKGRDYGHEQPRVREVDNSEVEKLEIYWDNLDEWGYITASEQLFELTHTTEYHPPSLIHGGWDGITTTKIAYCEPFKPNEPTEIVIVYSKWVQRELEPPLNQEEREAELGGDVCLHGNLAETCTGFNYLAPGFRKCTRYRKWIPGKGYEDKQ